MSTPRTTKIALIPIGLTILTGLALMAVPSRPEQPTEQPDPATLRREAGEEYFAAAMALREEGHQHRAMRLLYSALQITPDLPRLRYQLGRCHERIDERQHALPHYLAEWKHHRYDRALYEAGEILVDADRFDELKALFAEAGPDDLRRTEQFCYLRGKLAEAKGRRRIAFAAYREALRHDEEYHRAEIALDELGTGR